MRRSPLVIGATIAGTAGILAFHPGPATVQAVAGTTKSTAPALSSSTTSASSSGTGSATASATTTSSQTSTGVSGAATGSAIATQYGNVQVRVTVKNGKIVAIQPLQLTSNDPRSAQISASAQPTLKQEALTKQSAAIDSVSGATYTSAGYAQSLQSALDKLGFKGAARTTLQVPA